MTGCGALQTLDGLLDEVAREGGGPPPGWATAYRQLFVDEVVHSHHVGFIIGLAKGTFEESASWVAALTTVTEAPGHRWALEKLWGVAHELTLSELSGSTIEANPDAVAEHGPMMIRVHGAIRAHTIERDWPTMQSLKQRLEVYQALEGHGAHKVACGLEVVGQHMTLARVDDARALLAELVPMVQEVSCPLLRIEFHERSADLARDEDRTSLAMEHYYRAANLAREAQSDGLPVDAVIAETDALIQKGRFHAARQLLEQDLDPGTDTFAPMRRQRRLTVRCYLYVTLDDRAALLGAVTELAESSVAHQWCRMSDVGSQIDDLVNLACQFGDQETAERALALGETLLPGPITRVWLALAQLRLEAWRRDEKAAAEAFSRVMEHEARYWDLALCQTVVTFGDTWATEEQELRLWGDIEDCVDNLLDQGLHQQAAAGLRFKALRYAQDGDTDTARTCFSRAVNVLQAGDVFGTLPAMTAMEWASWEIAHGHLDQLEVPIGLVIKHSEDPHTSRLLARLSFEQAMFFTANPEMGEPDEDPRAVVGRWIARAADQYVEGERIEEANDVYVHLVDWLDEQGEPEAGTSILEMLNEGAVASGDPHLIWQVARTTARRLHRRGEPSEAIELIETALTEAALEDPASRGAQHFELATLLNLSGRGAEALEHHELAIEGLRDGSVSDRARTLMGLGLAHWLALDEGAAIEAWGEAMKLAYLTTDRDFVAEMAQRIDDRLLERYDRVGGVRMASLERLVTVGQQRRWELVANGSDLPLRWAEELARIGQSDERVDDAVRTLLDLADAVTGMGLTLDGTALMQRAAGIQMLRGHHDAGLELMREILDRVEATGGTIIRAREGLLQAALLTGGGLVHEAWDRLSEVRDWLATSCDEEEDEAAVDELSLSCQLQCAGLNLLGDRPDAVVTPLSELVATCDSRDEQWPAAQSARVSLAAALTTTGQAEEAAAQLMALEANLAECTTGWFDGVVMAGRIGHRALGEALVIGAQVAFDRSHLTDCSAIGIAVAASKAWLGFTSGEGVDREESEGLAKRSLDAHDFELATVLHLLLACYASDAGDEAGAREAVCRAVEVARTHWTMDELGLMWGALLPPTLKRYTASLLEADRLQHVN